MNKLKHKNIHTNRNTKSERGTKKHTETEKEREKRLAEIQNYLLNLTNWNKKKT